MRVISASRNARARCSAATSRCPSCFVWLAAGASMQRFLRTERAARIFNVTMGALLGGSLLLVHLVGAAARALALRHELMDVDGRFLRWCREPSLDALLHSGHQD